MKKVLSPTKQKIFKKRIFGFDVETINNNKDFLMCSIVGIDRNGQDFKKVFFTKQDFINHLKTNYIYRNSVIFATNLSFDFFGMFFNNEDSKNFKTIFRGTELLNAKTYFKKTQFTNENKNNTKPRKSLSFLDTMNFCKLSVEKMGKILNLPKLTKPRAIGRIPFNNDEMIEMIKYNIRDSEITYEFAKFLISSFNELGANFKMTIASSSMSLFRNKYLKEKYYVHDDNILIDIFKAYYGGRTETFKRGFFENVNYYDFNSLYPSVMHDYMFPNPNTLRITHHNTNRYILEYEGVSHIDIYIPKSHIPILPIKTKTGKVIFGYGNISGWYSHIELREAINNGAVLKRVYKTYYYKEMCNPFKDYVNDLYNKRLTYKKEGSNMELIIKLCLNSLYGKFGQRFISKENTYHVDSVDKEMLNRAKNINRVGDYFVITEDCEPSNFCFPIWSVYISAYARLKLYKILNRYDPIYCDTDSIITNYDIPNSNRLGELKKEMTITQGITVRPKFYAIYGHDNIKDVVNVKIKGLGKRLSYYEFVGLVNMPISINNINYTKKINYEKFAKFKEAIRRDFIPNEKILVNKTFSLEDEKRVWHEEFNANKLITSEAINLDDIQCEIR